MEYLKPGYFFDPERLTLAFKVTIMVALVGLAPYAWAQTQAEIDAASRQAEIIQRQQQERLQADLERIKPPEPRVNGLDLRTPSIPTGTDPVAGNCRDIEEIVVEGADLLRKAALEHIARDFSGRCLGVGDIEKVLGLITKDYIEQGYITTRAYLPAQDLKTGRLKILVMEGSVEGYRLEGDDAKRIFVPGVFPAGPGDTLNLRDLEQGVEQMNRLASNNARMDIEPGAEPGKSVVVVRNQASTPIHLNLGYDNQGSESTGKNAISGSLTLDGVLGLNERWIASGRSADPSDGPHISKSTSLDLWVPVGYFSFGASVSESSYRNKLLLPSGSQLETTGTTESNAVKMDYVAYRDQSSRLTFAGKLKTDKTLNYIEKQLLSVSSRNLTSSELGVSGSTTVAGGFLSVQLAQVQGLKIWNALQDADNISADAPRAQFEKTTYDLSFSKPLMLLTQPIMVSSQWSGQYARTPLFGSQQISIGGISSVRGFTANTISGDKGYYVRNEVSLPTQVSVLNEKLSGRYYLGFDFGDVAGLAAGSSAGRLSGATLGVAAQWRGANLEIFSSWPISQPANMTPEPLQTWFRVSYSL